MKPDYNPDPAHPPSMTPHQVAMQMRAVEKACEENYHVSDLAMTVASEVWRHRESSVRRVARVLQETLVRRVSDLEAQLKDVTERWTAAWKATGAYGDSTTKEVLDRIRMACMDYAAKERGTLKDAQDIKDWALALLRRSSVTDFPDACDYARWVRSVSCAAADQKERWLEELENEFCKHISDAAKARASAGNDF